MIVISKKDRKVSGQMGERGANKIQCNIKKNFVKLPTSRKGYFSKHKQEEGCSFLLMF